ncbi:PREDICTED: uncharacterized protein LOC108563744 isoform X2 [Nicrophorus vespilloides]|uniref:Uncharacterized protein LOC108563744 isoform X2 n=1 Tax=Nicrophorus vespilloides TaxID=110193 RepID=A0ABM1MTV2_NICVS|nr:PREDICTED: uncharacterized protein LOC108563744 isoform X2 [Nicrophorus vespilloides]
MDLMNGSMPANQTSPSSVESSTTRVSLYPLNATLPPEQYRFIPGSTPTFVNKTVTNVKERSFNGTGYYIEEEGESGFNDIQTLFLACFATLIPLVIILVTGFVIRVLWRRYKRRTTECMDYDGVIHRESSFGPPERPLHSHLLNGDKLVESHVCNSAEEICDGAITNGIKETGNSHSTTNDIEEDSRETTMKYSPGARDSVFVVEVQQGVRRSPSGGAYGADDMRGANYNYRHQKHQCALVHNEPDTDSEEDQLGDSYYQEDSGDSGEDSPEVQEMVTCRTGLSQSNQSLANQSYSYGNQQGYDNGFYGYPTYSGYINDEPPQKLEDSSKPKITSAVYKSPRTSDQMDPLLSDLSVKRVEDVEEQIRSGDATGDD